jgi:hypothetical protein
MPAAATGAAHIWSNWRREIEGGKSDSLDFLFI